ncbi:MAG: right-handed parallel beta-helix repeat-containing protein [Candidatus Pacebacteria bacterium]|nr:right-handed parallel beta-helix repeat-containing protein [Candidatus Paceibacterota bacterium]
MHETNPLRATGHGLTNETIQRAIDSKAKAGGGVVEVPAGEYWLHDAVHLRTGVHVKGEPGTIFRKVPSVRSPIVDFLGYGHYEITVAEPEKFRVGMGIHVMDNAAMGFYTTVATIVGIEGERLFLDRMLNHDYTPDAEAVAISVFSLVEADRTTDAGIESVCLDGTSGKETFQLNGCRGAGVFIYQSRRITVQDVEVRNYRGDGISFQQNTDIIVKNCNVHHNVGGGIHPGSGTVRYELDNNHIHDNGACGIFYCLRTTHSLCTNNVVENNGQAGISVGERDTDHVLSGNTIRNNQGPGILFREPRRRGGDRVLIADNTIARNCWKDGTAELEIAAGLHRIQVKENDFSPANHAAISLAEGCTDIFIENNRVSGHALQPPDIAGRYDLATFSSPTDFPPVGPSALPEDGARHLNIRNTNQ